MEAQEPLLRPHRSLRRVCSFYRERVNQAGTIGPPGAQILTQTESHFSEDRWGRRQKPTVA